MSITVVEKGKVYKADETFEYHLGKRSLDVMKKYSDKIHHLNFTDNISETHGSVRTRSIRAAQALSKRGVGLKDVILLCSTNNTDIAIPFIAALYIGSASCSIPEDQSLTERLHVVDMLRPKIVFCNPSQAKPIEDTLQQLSLEAEIVVFGDEATSYTPFSEFTEPTGTEEEFIVTEFDPATTNAVISCSSGTTGLSKGVCLNHRQLSLVIQLPTSKISPEALAKDKMIYFSGFSWISGSIINIMSCVLGCTLLQSPLPFDSEIFFKAVKEYRPTTGVFNEANICKFLLHPQVDEIDLNCFKLFLIVGSACSKSTMTNLESRVPDGKVSNNYGMTECCGPLSHLPILQAPKPNTVGQILPWIEWKVVDPQTGKDLPVKQTGELLCRGETFFKEYYRNPQATEESFTSDGWFKTGDLMYYDEENFLYPAGRIKEIIKYAGNQISPAELERVIRQNDGVDKVCVVGKAAHGVGDIPLAFVQKKPGAKVTAQEVKEIVEKSLSDYKRLRGGVVFMEELPLTHNGKINRHQLNNLKDTVTVE